MPEFDDWQRATLLNQIIANIGTMLVDGFYPLDMRLTARQCDLLQNLANIFDALTRAQGGPPTIEDPGGD